MLRKGLVQGYKLSVVADYALAKVTLDLIEQPYFYFHEYKPRKKSKDPIAQVLIAKLTAAQREERGSLFGTLADGRRPIDPYLWRLASGRTLLELPVTTMPVARVPFHLSYLLYLSRISEGLMVAYLRTALATCRATGTEPSFLLHPLDLLGGDQVRELAFFPGMDLTGARKIAVFLKVLRILGDQFRLVNMSTHARAILARPALGERVVEQPSAGSRQPSASSPAHQLTADG